MNAGIFKKLGVLDDRPSLTIEHKFLVPAAARAAVAAVLEASCLPDPEYPFNVVHSLYLDTLTLRALREKLDGDYLKTKYRLRWYADTQGRDAGPVYVEVKLRQGGGRDKLRHKIPWPGADLERRLASPETLALELQTVAASLGLPAGIFPCVRIRYGRRRYVCPFTRARVNLDTDIESVWAGERLSAQARWAASPVDVLEVKLPGPAETPGLEALYRTGVRARSFSKYGYCVKQLLGGTGH